MSSFLKYLNTSFALRDLSHANYFLGVEITHANNALHLNQQKYIHDLLTHTSMLDSKPATTPKAFIKSLSQFDGDPFLDASFYRSIVGAFQYINLIRPNIFFAVNKACQFMANPTTTH